jgi:hypothetical protein
VRNLPDEIRDRRIRFETHPLRAKFASPQPIPLCFFFAICIASDDADSMRGPCAGRESVCQLESIREARSKEVDTLS